MSSRRCVVKGCKSSRPHKTKSFHRIPTNVHKRTIWLNRLNLPGTVNGRVCSKHFRTSDFVIKGDGACWLRTNAYPKRVDIQPGEFESEVEDNGDEMGIGVTPINPLGTSKVNADRRNSRMKRFGRRKLNEYVIDEYETDWKEVEINIDDLPHAETIDTIANFEMNCSVIPLYDDTTSEEHNYSKALTRKRKTSTRDWIVHRRRELRFDITFFRNLDKEIKS